MNKKYIVRLPNPERQELLALVDRGRTAARTIKRAWILLQADTSPTGPAWSDEQIPKAYGVGWVTIYRVRQTGVEEGLDAVWTRRLKSRHRRRQGDGEQEAHLIALACSEPPAGRKRWTMRLLAQSMIQLGYCQRVCAETVRQTLKKTN
jgi:hypothetical protein